MLSGIKADQSDSLPPPSLPSSPQQLELEGSQSVVSVVVSLVLSGLALSMVPELELLPLIIQS
jgi:hypothetical protein